jgi:hypothetical protein
MLKHRKATIRLQWLKIQVLNRDMNKKSASSKKAFAFFINVFCIFQGVKHNG